MADDEEPYLEASSSKLEYQTILNLLDESYKDCEHADSLLDFVRSLANSSIQDLKQVPKQIGTFNH